MDFYRLPAIKIIYCRVVTGPKFLNRSDPAGHPPVEKASQTGKNRQKLTGLFDHLLSIK
jgi:hypothetical protein